MRSHVISLEYIAAERQVPGPARVGRDRLQAENPFVAFPFLPPAGLGAEETFQENPPHNPGGEQGSDKSSEGVVLLFICILFEMRALPGFFQDRVKIGIPHARGVENPFVETHKQDERRFVGKSLVGFSDHSPIRGPADGPAVAESPDIGVFIAKSHGRGKFYPHVLRTGGEFIGDELHMQHIEIIERLDGVGHLIADRKHVRAV